MKKNELFSAMTGKLKGIPAINSNPLTNDFCQTMCENPKTICSQCYSQAMLKGIRSNCVPKFEKIGRLLSTEAILGKLPAPITEKYARFSAHGELINELHLLNYIVIAQANPKTKWALWTKRKDLVKKHAKLIPANVILIYSNPYIDKPMALPQGFDKVFSVFSKEYVAANKVKINCGGKKCMDCLLCYKVNKVTEVNELLK